MSAFSIRNCTTGRSEIYGKTPLTDEVRALTPPAAMDSFTTVVGSDGRFVPLAAHEFLSGGDDYAMWVVVAPKAMFPIDLTRADGTSLLEVAGKMVADWHPDIAAITARTGSLREAVRDYEIDMLDHGFAAVAASTRRGSS